MGSSSLGIYMSALYTLYTSDHCQTIPGDTRENVYTNIKKYSQQDFKNTYDREEAVTLNVIIAIPLVVNLAM